MKVTKAVCLDIKTVEKIGELAKKRTVHSVM